MSSILFAFLLFFQPSDDSCTLTGKFFVDGSPVSAPISIFWRTSDRLQYREQVAIIGSNNVFEVTIEGEKEIQFFVYHENRLSAVYDTKTDKSHCDTTLPAFRRYDAIHRLLLPTVQKP